MKINKNKENFSSGGTLINKRSREKGSYRQTLNCELPVTDQERRMGLSEGRHPDLSFVTGNS